VRAPSSQTESSERLETAAEATVPSGPLHIHASKKLPLLLGAVDHAQLATIARDPSAVEI
jgi:hypothetical protein